MPGKVADASVLGAVVFQEPRQAEAIALLGDDDLYAPTLLAYELCSIARKKALLDPQQVESVARVLSAALLMEMQWMSVDQAQVLRLAVETGLSTYDASYLYVARLMDMQLVTFDEELRKADDGTKG